jgi:hypothetical protein
MVEKSEYDKTHTNISVLRTTRDKLQLIGRKGDSYDDILRKVLLCWAEKHSREWDIKEIDGKKEAVFKEEY